jgi:chromosome segregation ATPase
VQALSSAAGEQQQGAGDAVKELLESVKVFSEALGESQGAVQSASLKVVASTEQVTAEAARRVAEALSKGAETFEASMARVERVGAQLDGHGAALQRNVAAAERAAGALEGHGAAMLRSATDLKAELVGVVKPLNDARASILTVPGAVEAAVTAMETERSALTGLGASLKDQANLVREEHQQLSERAKELRGVTAALGGEIAAHINRITAAQQKVAEAWALAMNGADATVLAQSEAIANYAGKVSEAVGIGPLQSQLNESLADLAEGLAPLKDLSGQIAALNRSIQALQTALAVEEA